MVLHGSDRHDRAGSLDLVDRNLGDADVPDSAAVAIFLDGREAFLKRCLRIDPVQIIESNGLGAQAAEAFLDLGAEILRTSTTGATGAALRGDDVAVTEGRKRRSDRRLALPTRISVSGVDQPHA